MPTIISRSLLALTAIFCLTVASGGCSNQVLNLVERQIAANMTADPVGDLPDGLHVLVCGAGGPLPDEKRTSACLMVIAGDSVMLFDVGGGSARTMALNEFLPGLIERVFITHFHSDHIDGLGEVATLRWAGGDWDSPLMTHGPDGVAEIVSGFNLAYHRDQVYRTEHHGLEVTPPTSWGLAASAFALPEDGEAPVVFESGDLRVTAFAVDHEPVSPAVGYRIQYKDRSIAISGDTAKSANLIEMTQGVDVLFHEALSKVIVRRMNAAAETAGNSGMAKITMDILDYHASPIEAAESAQEAGASALVVYHVVPPLPISPLEGIFREGMDDAFDGEIEISVDGTFVSLPAGSNEIDIDSP